MIISPGVGSGLDINGLVTQLVAAEGQPAALRLSRQEARVQAELSAFGSFKSALSSFRDALEPLKELDKFQGRVTTTGDDTIFTASATSSSVPGSYSIEVRQLAQAHKLASDPFADADTVVGTGTLTLTVGDQAFAVEIDDSNNTLAGIRDAINGASSNTGVRATIVNGNDGSTLILSSVDTGVENSLVVTAAGGDGGLDGLVYDPAGTMNLTELQAALDAEVIIDGFSVTSAGNSLTDAIEGVTLDLIAAQAGTTVELTVDYDRTNAKDLVNAFIESYNALVKRFSELTKFDPETKEKGALLGDSTLRAASSQIRREMSIAPAEINGAVGSLLDIGITIQLDGTLELDEGALTAQLDANFDDLGKLFSTEDGYAVRLDELLGRYLDDGGLIENRTDGLDERIEDIERQREALDRRLEAVEERLRAQFNALDTLVSQLNSTSAFLAQQLVNLPGATFQG